MNDGKNKGINRNVLIILILALVIVALLVIALLKPGKVDLTGADVWATQTPVAVTTDGKSETGTGASAGAVLCRLTGSGDVGILPLPAEGEISYPIRQVLADGTETENILHLTPDGFYMESSTCKNQNCVQQGKVTFENRDYRILTNCVVCLPNQVTAELYDTQEIDRMMAGTDTKQTGEE